MKVLQHTAQRLTIQERLFGIGLLSVATISTGIFMFFLFESPVDWIGAFCIALGIVFTALAPTEVLIFDKGQQSLTIHQRRLLRQRTMQYPIVDILAVEVNTVDFLHTRFYRINLKLASGESLAVTHTISTDWQQQQKILRHIRGFINLPPRHSTASPLPSTRLSH